MRLDSFVLGFLVIQFLVMAQLVRLALKKHWIVLNSFLLWFFLVLFLLILALFPNPLFKVTAWMGFEIPSNGLFFIGILGLFLLSFAQSIENARLKTQVVRLAQHMSLKFQRRDSA